jgi:hypothetical protein
LVITLTPLVFVKLLSIIPSATEVNHQHFTFYDELCLYKEPSH